MIKKISALFISAVSMLFFAVPAFAHVIVSPKQVGVAAYQEFSMAVPSEKDSSTVSIKLTIPDGLSSVTPNVKAGWTINEVKQGTGDSAKVTEIDWTGGAIPSGQRDDFLFQAQVPAKETTLKWKAVQQYQDGSIVSWTHDPTSNPEDDSAPPPYSQTKIVNDLTGSGANAATMNQVSNNTGMGYSSKRAMLPIGLSIVAIVLSLIALGVAIRKK